TRGLVPANEIVQQGAQFRDHGVFDHVRLSCGHHPCTRRARGHFRRGGVVMGVVKLLSFVLFLLGATYAAAALIVDPLDINPMQSDAFPPKLPDMGPTPEIR